MKYRKIEVGDIVTDWHGQTRIVIAIKDDVVSTKPYGNPFLINPVIQTGNTIESILPLDKKK
jgi:hypothetical protein